MQQLYALWWTTEPNNDWYWGWIGERSEISTCSEFTSFTGRCSALSNSNHGRKPFFQWKCRGRFFTEKRHETGKGRGNNLSEQACESQLHKDFTFCEHAASRNWRVSFLLGKCRYGNQLLWVQEWMVVLMLRFRGGRRVPFVSTGKLLWVVVYWEECTFKSSHVFV